MEDDQLTEMEKMKNIKITDVRAFVLDQTESGGDYHDREKGHFLVDTLIATPM